MQYLIAICSFAQPVRILQYGFIAVVIGLLAVSSFSDQVAAASPISVSKKGSNGGNGNCGKHGHNGDDIWSGTETVQANSGNISASGEPGVSVTGTGGTGGHGSSGNCSLSGGKHGGYGGGPISLRVAGPNSISTSGTDAHGVVITLANGGGGSGGDSNYGDGGNGGNGDKGDDTDRLVTVVNNANLSKPSSAWSIITTGSNASGVQIDWFGGDGGAGNRGSADGGHGGAGGLAGAISLGTGASTADVPVELSISTTGSSAPAISLNAIDGGGKGGGEGVGGKGGKGGNGGGSGNSGNSITQIYMMDTSLTTAGNNSATITMVRQGGNGGNGGSGKTFGNGGDGGLASGGGDIFGLSQGQLNLSTKGDNSHGLAAYSIGGKGGKGGDGGFVSNSGGGGSVNDSGTVSFSLNTGGTNSFISTVGDGSYGIILQSIGGHGGSASQDDGIVTFSADGGSGGAGGTAYLFSDVAVQTHGNGANAISAQAIGGGGGHGGDAFGVFFSGSGDGGSGGDGGGAFVNNNGDLTTYGYDSSGIMAQSIGGAGGAGGSSDALVALGGRAGDGSDGGQVQVIINGGTIETGKGPASAPASDLCAGCSLGIMAQSIGGGGGHGSSSGGWFAIGASGGGGGDGGQVSATTDSSITTHLDLSQGILAQSIGGGGGHGAAAAGGGVALSASVGGSGGSGGDGGSVTVSNQVASGGALTISTSGDTSHGIQAQSIGGGGGHGGYAVSASASFETPSIAIAIGGSGGSGGDAGTVKVSQLSNNGSMPAITTQGDRAQGLVAQSVGGGGGHGGFSIAATATVGDTGAGGISFGLGGDGGSGGHGGSVSATNEGTITTRGISAPGLVAQSIGGGGGSGALNVSADVSIGSGGIAAGVGGFGGTGGNASTVMVATTAATVSTSGDHSTAILAQSLGGGGGDGGTSIAGTLSTTGATDMSVGGFGGTGGNGAAVTVKASASSAPHTTDGDHSSGIVAQSIGGGGGNGGLSIAAAVSTSKTTDLGVSVGGNGGSGGTADSVDVTGDAATAGDHATAIVAQSIGGGGGNGGTSIAGTLSTSSSQALNVSVGGKGATGHQSGSVSVQATNVSTAGTLSDGILAQSLGGDGGNGGLSVAGDISTSQSTGLTVAIGGGGGAAGKASTVTVQFDGEMTIAGTESRGIVAQSIGGGGGNGGMSISGALSTSTTTKDVAVAVGGAAGSGADGNTVTVNQTGGTGIATTNTSTTGAHAIIAQSIGGGGGSGGMAISSAANRGDRSLAVSVGGSGSSGGLGGAVSVTTDAPIQTAAAGSHGVYAQSVGGGGGHGGATFTVGESSKTAKGLQVLVGGSGGTGKHAAEVDVTNTSSILLGGYGSMGIVAQSIGGGGGNGGSNVVASAPAILTKLTSNTVGVGGAGGSGGAGSTVTVDNSGSITGGSTGYVGGQAGHGIFAQSISGGGGNGGSGLKGDAGAGDSNVEVGGKGAGTDAGGIVEVTNSGSVAVVNPSAHAIFAQSVGGGGGNGGAGIEGEVSHSAETGIGVDVGGSGSGGGDGGMVTVANTGTLSSAATGGKGIMASSVGGGGGIGGSGIAGDLTDSSSSTSPRTGSQIELSIGGSAGTGSDGGAVSVTNNGGITTGKTSSGIAQSYGQMDGIFAQSVGGGGGAGGFGISGAVQSERAGSGASLQFGGKGGGGGAGGDVTVSNNGTIDSYGDQSRAIFAQSVGGGGGAGGIGLGSTVDGGGDIDPSDGASGKTVGLSVGGDGGTGGNGGAVTLTNTGMVTTYDSTSGLHSQQHGIFGQSVGGGGGSGAFTGGYVGTTSVGGPTEFTGAESGKGVSLKAGSINAAGHGGDVLVETNGLSSVVTNAPLSHGLVGQSIGGGGGTTGDLRGMTASDFWNAFVQLGAEGGAGGNGGTTSVWNGGTASASAVVSLTGAGSIGLLGQSIGAGGGIGGGAAGSTGLANASVSVNLGAKGGANGGGGDVGMLNLGTLSNTVAPSVVASGSGIGIMAQSVGGGGGIAALGLVSQSSSINLGAATGSGGDGGNVSAAIVGNIATGFTPTPVAGVLGAHGVVAQSVGGGGGYAGNVSFGAEANFGTNLAMSDQGATGEGDGGDISVIAEAGTSIYVSGAGSLGIIAQSVGGGGGIKGDGGATVADALVGSGGGVGSSGDITVETGGVLTTNGVNAHAIFAQSAAGNAGTGSNGASGDVSVSVTAGTVSAPKSGAHGIIGQSISRAGLNGQVSVDISAGATVTGGTTATAAGKMDGTAIVILDGNSSNSITNAGSIVAGGGVNGEAIVISQGSIANTGSIIGQITKTQAAPAQQPQTVSLYNGADGVIVSGLLLELDSTVNEGMLELGGSANALTIGHSGAFQNLAGGTIVMDLVPVINPVKGTHADLLTIGSNADLGGTIDVNIHDDGNGGSGRQSITIIEASGGLTADELTVAPSAVAQYQLQRTANSVMLSYDIDFVNPSVTPHLAGNQQQIAAHIDAQYRNGGIGEELLHVTEAANADAYASDLDALSPAAYGVGGSAALMSGMQFSDSLLSCKERDGANRFIRETDCLRLDGGVRHYSQDNTSGTPGFDLAWGGIGLGGQTEVAEGWIIGGGFAYEALNGSSNADLWGSDGDQFQAGIALKRQMGPALLAASLGGGFGAIDVRRQAAPGVTAKGDQDFVSVSSQFRGAYAFEFTDWYIKPLADLNLTYVNTGSVTETGAGAANLRVDGSDEFYVSIRPAIEFGMELEADSGSGTAFRPRVSVGVTQFLTDPSQSVTATFAGAAPGVAPFTVQNDMDRTSLDLEIGLDVFTRRNVQFSLNGATQLSKNAMNIGGSLRLAIAF